jgi:hypothetical protein
MPFFQIFARSIDSRGGATQRFAPYLDFGKTQFIKLLQIHPELRAGAKPMPETQRRIGGNTALAMDDAGDPVHRHLDLPRKLRRTDANLAQFFRQMFAGVDRCTRHNGFPQW